MHRGKSKDKKLTLPYNAELCTTYQEHDFMKTVTEAYLGKGHVEHESSVVLYNEPFQCCCMSNFVKDKTFLEGLKDELEEQIFYEKNNDLYKFQQTDDLKKINSPHIKLVRKLFYEDVLQWMRNVTQIPLTSKVDITCSKYEHTDVLLCHDDELDTRRIAFILYLVPSWSAEDGGTLDLFNMDEHGQPNQVVRSLVPCFNTFAWFEVTEASHHQVSEVLSADKIRLSINGWFHSSPVPRQDRHVEPLLPFCSYLSVEEDLVYKWLNPVYLDPEVQSQIQEKFESDSEIELQGFIREEKYQELVEALKHNNMQWSLAGPPNKRCYQRASKDNFPGVVQECLSLMQSEAMFLTLSNLTGLTLHQLAAESSEDPAMEAGGSCSDTMLCGTHAADTNNEVLSTEVNSESEDDQSAPERKRLKLTSDNCATVEHVNVADPRCRFEVRRWGHGCYTLVHDTDMENAEFALDAMLFCSCKEWKQDMGGYTSYISKGEDEELLTVGPTENSLALVYRDKETTKFVKHINSKIEDLQSHFFDIHLVYHE